MVQLQKMDELPDQSRLNYLINYLIKYIKAAKLHPSNMQGHSFVYILKLLDLPILSSISAIESNIWEIRDMS